MPRPFPLPLRVGTDIAHTARFHRLLLPGKGRSPRAFARKILTPQEFMAQEEMITDLAQRFDQLGWTNEVIAKWKLNAEWKDFKRKLSSEPAIRPGLTVSQATSIYTQLRGVAQFLAGRSVLTLLTLSRYRYLSSKFRPY